MILLLRTYAVSLLNATKQATMVVPLPQTNYLKIAALAIGVKLSGTAYPVILGRLNT